MHFDFIKYMYDKCVNSKKKKKKIKACIILYDTDFIQ